MVTIGAIPSRNNHNNTMISRVAAFCAGAIILAFSSPAAWAEDPLPGNTATVKQAFGEPAEPLSADPPWQADSGSTEAASGDGVAASDTETPASAAPEDLWERIRNGFALPELDTPLVQQHEAWYANRPEYVQRMVERSQRYLFFIVEEVEKRGMPTEIALLPMIESAYNPKAYSRSHASGIWQFIPATGRNYGLEQNWWYDKRRDILAATRAALNYLQSLYDMFGSWDLALAAYNWGEGAVSRAIARNQARGEPTDYLSLNMPAETRNYVPKLLAVKHLVMNPSAFGLALAPIANAPYFAKVTTNKHIDLALAARLAEIPVEEFVSLNPAHNRPVIASKGSHTLLLPVEKVETFTANLENYSKPLVSWQPYTSKRSEKLAVISRKFGISIPVLKRINGLSERKKTVAPGETLLVPLKGARADVDIDLEDFDAPQPEPVAETVRVTHKVRKGETLAGIARRYDVSIARIKAWNRLKTERLAPGRTLALVVEKESGKRTAILARADAPRKVRQAAAGGKSASAKRSHANTRVAAKRTHYTVRRGDTVTSIAKRFKVAVNDLQRWNNLPSGRSLSPGTRVALYR